MQEDEEQESSKNEHPSTQGQFWGRVPLNVYSQEVGNGLLVWAEDGVGRAIALTYIPKGITT